MTRLRISLFGSFRATYDGCALNDWGSSKAEELLCYVLLNRERPQSRELLASALWENATTAQSRAYLRKALWQVRSVFRALPGPDEQPILLATSDFIRQNPDVHIWLDVECFEAAYMSSKGMPGHELDEERAALLCDAVDLYKGDLLEDCFHEWSLQERERFRYLLLSMLDKLISYCESRGNYEAATSFAERSLSHDSAREYTHRQLMRLRYLSGDRTGAVRQYSLCAKALREELHLEPAEATVRLYEKIRTDAFTGSDPHPNVKPDLPPKAAHDMLNGLKTAINLLAETNDRIREEIAVLEESLFRVEGWISGQSRDNSENQVDSRKENAAGHALETRQEMLGA